MCVWCVVVFCLSYFLLAVYYYYYYYFEWFCIHPALELEIRAEIELLV